MVRNERYVWMMQDNVCFFVVNQLSEKNKKGSKRSRCEKEDKVKN